MEGSRLPNKLILGHLMLCLNFNTFAGNLGTKLEKRNEKNRENGQDISEIQAIFKVGEIPIYQYGRGLSHRFGQTNGLSDP